VPSASSRSTTNLAIGRHPVELIQYSILDA
jgi:hypothetical protein